MYLMHFFTNSMYTGHYTVESLYTGLLCICNTPLLLAQADRDQSTMKEQVGRCCRFFTAKLENILEDRDQLEASQTIIGRLLTCMVEEGAIAPHATNKCAPAPPTKYCSKIL